MKRSRILAPMVLAMTAGLTTAALSASTATNNQCWGDIAQQVGSFGAMGEHTRAGAPFTSQPRQGAANANTTADGAPGDGGLGNHAIRVGGFVDNVATNPDLAIQDKDGNVLGLDGPLVCDGTPGNPGPGLVP